MGNPCPVTRVALVNTMVLTTAPWLLTMLIQRKLGEAYMGTLLYNYFKLKKKNFFQRNKSVLSHKPHITEKQCFTTNPLTLRDKHNTNFI